MEGILPVVSWPSTSYTTQWAQSIESILTTGYQCWFNFDSLFVTSVVCWCMIYWTGSDSYIVHTVHAVRRAARWWIFLGHNSSCTALQAAAPCAASGRFPRCCWVTILHCWTGHVETSCSLWENFFIPQDIWFCKFSMLQDWPHFWRTW